MFKNNSFKFDTKLLIVILLVVTIFIQFISTTFYKSHLNNINQLLEVKNKNNARLIIEKNENLDKKAKPVAEHVFHRLNHCKNSASTIELKEFASSSTFKLFIDCDHKNAIQNESEYFGFYNVKDGIYYYIMDGYNKEDTMSEMPVLFFVQDQKLIFKTCYYDCGSYAYEVIDLRKSVKITDSINYVNSELLQSKINTLGGGKLEQVDGKIFLRNKNGLLQIDLE